MRGDVGTFDRMFFFQQALSRKEKGTRPKTRAFKKES
jgi:hypothetical protein